jgi:hypothetical protein
MDIFSKFFEYGIKCRYLAVNSNYVLRVSIEPLGGLTQEGDEGYEVRRVVILDRIANNLIV